MTDEISPPAIEIRPEDLEAARVLIGLEEKWLQPFRAADPFNDGREIEGFLSVRPDHRYGALAILRVDGKPAPQVIPATPKLHYPFDRNGVFRFPPVRRITIYEKLDGTNVLAYRYRDSAGASYLTYKLRLFPFLRNGRFGDFLDMWKELLSRHPAIPSLVDENRTHMSFEMYGNRNSHLIEYTVGLECAALFGVGADWRIAPLYRLELAGTPAAGRIAELVAGEDPVAKYQSLRAEIEGRNRPADEGRIAGSEGAVWYIEAADGSVSLWKCKPESVEAIHWTGGIGKDAVIATCRNVLETADALTVETLKPLLLEEYDEQEIEAFMPHILECIAVVKQEMEFIERVMAAYAKTGLSIHRQKNETMRSLSASFERREMKRVYTFLMQRAGA